jgi:hypothetical protein
MIQTVRTLLGGAIGGALLGWAVLNVVYINATVSTLNLFKDPDLNWRGNYSKYINQRLPDGYWRWTACVILIGALISSTYLSFKVCARLPGHPWIC